MRVDISINSRLAEAIKIYEGNGGTPYVAQMWRFALGFDPASGEDPVQSQQCDAIPYLPIEPETYGVTLTAQSRILDVGCLGGYGLFDIARRLRHAGRPIPTLVGVDIAPETIALANKLAAIWAQGIDVDFHVSSAEALNPDLGKFDIVISRLVLPYTDVRTALVAMRSALAENGLLILQVHAPAYYWRQAAIAWPAWKKTVYYLRPLLVYGWFALTGRQLRFRRTCETALNHRLLSRLGGRRGLSLLDSGGFKAKPWFVYGVRND